MATLQQLTLDDLPPALEVMADQQLLDLLRSLKEAEAMEDLLAARREGIRRGIVIKLEVDLPHAERARLAEVRAEVGRSWYRVEEWEGAAIDPGRTRYGRDIAKEVLAEAKQSAVQAELALRRLDKELGLQRFGRYRFTEG